MDGVLDYLPSPNDRKTLDPFKYFGTSMSARVFKIVHEKQKGPVTYLRLYSGILEKVKINSFISKFSTINYYVFIYSIQFLI